MLTTEDIRMRVAAHQQMRAQYEVGKQELQDKKEDYEEIDKRLEHAAGVSLVLRSNIAQGVLQKGDESKHNEPNTLTAELDDGPTATTEQGVFSMSFLIFIYFFLSWDKVLTVKSRTTITQTLRARRQRGC